MSLIAVFPISDVFDTEVQAARRAGFPIVRFRFLDALEVVEDESSFRPPPARRPSSQKYHGLARLFMLSAERYKLLYDSFLREHHIELTTNPTQYAAAHYFPATYPLLAEISPRACWSRPVVSGRGGNSVDATQFDECVATVHSWNIAHVMLKDYVKSAKPHFIKVPVKPEFKGSPSLAQQAVDFVHARGSAFNMGVVFKEFLPLRVPSCEWRCWFVHGEFLQMNFNSEIDDYSSFAQSRGRPPSSASVPVVPQPLIEAAARAAKATGSPFVTVDFALLERGGWICLEAGDGGVSGPAVVQDLDEFFVALKEEFESRLTFAVSLVVNIHSKVDVWRSCL